MRGDEGREVRRILRRLSGEVSRVARPLGYALDVIAKLDLIAAKGKWSREFGMTEPDVNGEGRLWLRSARHPLLEHLFSSAECAVRSAEGGKDEDSVPSSHSPLRT